jgi:hypothetical protein
MTIRGALGLKAGPEASAGGAPRGLVEFSPLVVSAPDARGERTIRGTIALRGIEVDAGTRLEEVAGVLEVAFLRLGDDPEGKAALRLETVRVAGLLLRDLSMPLAWGGGILDGGPLEAGFYRGRLTGDVKVQTRSPNALEGRVRIRGMSIESLCQDLGAGPEIRGRAFADVEFQSRSSSFREFTAAGSAGVRDGDLGDLPPVANIPALLGSLLPFARKPTFERADVTFTVVDETVRARRLLMSGPLFDMEGHGTLDFSGNLDVTLSPQFIKSMVLPGALQVPGLGDILGLFREDPLYVIRIWGGLDDPKTVLDPLPFLGARRRPPEVSSTPFLGQPSRRIPSSFR